MTGWMEDEGPYLETVATMFTRPKDNPSVVYAITLLQTGLVQTASPGVVSPDGDLLSILFVHFTKAYWL